MAKGGFFRNAVNAMVTAREKQARRYVASALLMLDDETLKAAGHNRADLERSSRGAPYMF
ncbi:MULTISPECIES: hypothetical protein [unclassified Aminobacter]|jgi:hypothetical protein|uniref:hypothetical protein n=1 Tax=unclassified Aminobacter TaxID=2644704 RepID=UPI000467A55B|nr:MULTISPECIES: hypothetical protein [unclassified Aminobacter]TWG64777.1 hypothetical protein L610_001600000590 [Aminobacter sp. J44]TWH36719.1 hypothetical protein L611_000100002010 [Aminobacter sp. J15]